MIDPILIAIALAAIGGAIRSILGYEWQSDVGESFDALKFFKSIIRASIAGGFIGFYVIQSIETPNMAAYVSIMFLAVGADVMLKEVYGMTLENLKGGVK